MIDIDFESVDNIHAIDPEVLFSDTFLNKVIIKCKSNTYTQIIDKFHIEKPFENDSKLIDMPLWHSRFDIISLISSKNIDILKSDLWNYLNFTKKFFIYRKINQNKIIRRILNNLFIYDTLNEKKLHAIIHGIISNNQDKYLDIILSQANQQFEPFIIKTITLAAVLYQKVFFLQLNQFNTSFYINHPQQLIEILFNIRHNLEYNFLITLLNKCRII